MAGVTRLGKGIASLAAGVTGGIASLQPDEADAGIVVPFKAAKGIWSSKAVDDVLKEIDEYGTFFGHPDRTENWSVRARSDETWRQMEEHLTEKDFRDALRMRGQPWGSYNPAKPNDPFNQHDDEWLAARHYLRNLTEERQAANPLPPRENKVTVMSQADEAFGDGLDAPRKLTLDEKRAEYLKAQTKRKKDHELLNTPEKIEIEVQKQIDKRMEKDLNDMENANRLMWEASNYDIKWKPWSAAKRAEKKKELDFAEYEKGARQFVKSRELFSRPMSGGDEGYDSQRMRARGTRQQYLEETRDPEVRQKMAEENAESEIMGDMFGDEAEWYHEDPEGFIPYTQAQREKELAKKMPEQIKKELKAIEDKRKEFQNYPPELLAAAPAAGIPPATLMAEIQQPEYGTREDGTAKGEGYLGLIPTGRGDEVMSEKSMGIEVDGKEVLIPLIVPTLNSNEIEFLKTYDGPVQGIPESIKRKAQDHAFKRMGAGQSPFAESGDVPDQVPGARSSERQRIEDEYGLSTQAMLDRYQPSREPLADWEKLIDYRSEPNADRTHTVGYGTDDNAKAAEAYTDELKFGARYGLAEIPEQVPWLASMIADELPGAGYYQMATGQQLGDKMTEVEQNTHDYWAGKANTQGDDPSRTPEGLLPNMLRFGVGMGAETALVTAPFRVGRAVDQGVKSLRKGTAAAKAAPDTVDETRRMLVTGTPVAAATAGIAGLGGLRYLSKADDVAKAASKLKTPPKLLGIDDWIYKAKRPRNYPAKYMGDRRIYMAGQDSAGHNNYLRSYYKEFKEALGADEVRKYEKIVEDTNIPWRVIARQEPAERIKRYDKLYKDLKLNPEIHPRAYEDLDRIVRARYFHKHRMEQVESQLDELAEYYPRSIKESDETFDRYKRIANYRQNSLAAPKESMPRLKDVYEQQMIDADFTQ